MSGNPPAHHRQRADRDTTVGVSGAVAVRDADARQADGLRARRGLAPPAAGSFSAVTGAGVTADSAVARTGAYSLQDHRPGRSGAQRDRCRSARRRRRSRVYLRLAIPPGGERERAARRSMRPRGTTSGSATRRAVATPDAPLRERGRDGRHDRPSARGTWYRVDLRLTANTNPRTRRLADRRRRPDGRSRAAGTASTRQRPPPGIDRRGRRLHGQLRRRDDLGDARATTRIGAGTVVRAPAGRHGHEHATPARSATTTGRRSTRTPTSASTTSPMTEPDRLRPPADHRRERLRRAHLRRHERDLRRRRLRRRRLPCRPAPRPTTGRRASSTARTERIVFSGDMSADVAAVHLGDRGPGRRAVDAERRERPARRRIGYSSDVTPNPYWDALLLEVADRGLRPGHGHGHLDRRRLDGDRRRTRTSAPRRPTLLTWSTDR